MGCPKLIEQPIFYTTRKNLSRPKALDSRLDLFETTYSPPHAYNRHQ